MATMSERLAYVLDFNTSGAIRDVQKFGAVADKELGNADSRIDKLAGNMTKFGAGAMAFAGAAAVGLFKLGQGAAEAEANMAALEQVVGETVAAGIGDWAENSAQSVGLASKSAVAAATSFAQLGKIIGLGGEELGTFSTDLVQLSADFAAFKDVSPEQALQDIQAAFAGSTEVMRKYGIFLDDATLKQAYFDLTGEKVTGTLTSQQKIVAINAEMYRQGADMIGQWGRESEGFAGQQAILKASLTNLADAVGAGVLPAMTSMIGVVNDGVNAFSELSPETQATAGKFAGLAVAAIGALGAMSFMAGQAIKLKDRMRDAEGSLTLFGKSARVLGAATGVAAVALAGYSIQQRRAAEHTRQASEAMAELSRVTDDQVLATFTTAMAEAAFGGESLELSMRRLAETNIEGARRVLAMADAEGHADAATRALEQAIIDKGTADQQAARTAAEHGDAVEETIAITEDASAATSIFAEELDKEAGAASEAEAAQFSLSAITQEAADSALAAAEAQAELTEKLIDAVSGAFNLEKSMIGLNSAYKDYELQILETMDAQNDSELSDREKEKALEDLRLDEIALAESALATAQAYAAEQGAVEGTTESAQVQIETLRRMQETYPHLRDEIQVYIDKLLAVPGTVDTKISPHIDPEGFNFVQAKLDALARERIVNYSPNVRGSSGGSNIYRKDGGAIPGGVNQEVPIIAHGGEFVLSADVVSAIKKDKPTRGLGSTPTRIGSGGGTTINNNYFYTNADPSQVTEAFRRYERRN